MVPTMPFAGHCQPAAPAHIKTHIQLVVAIHRYREYWKAASTSGAHAVSITSWNEWGEGTQIEACQPWTDPDTGKPYQDYGTGGPWLYTNITQQQASGFIQTWHDKQANTADAEAVSAAGIRPQESLAGGGGEAAVGEDRIEL